MVCEECPNNWMVYVDIVPKEENELRFIPLDLLYIGLRIYVCIQIYQMLLLKKPLSLIKQIQAL